MATAGLCDSCIHRRDVRGARTTFVMCELAKSDRRFPRYPRLPVLQCAGHTPHERSHA